MKSISGNTHQNKKLVGISKSSSEMENERMSKGAMYQQKYRKKIEETNRTNAEFMQYATEQDPGLVQRFFEARAVILTKILLPS